MLSIPKKWVTRKRVHVNRAATAWLIRRFLDPNAEILFVEAGEVAVRPGRDGATGFDAPSATYPHKDAKRRCSFEQLVDEQLAGDPALSRLARIVRGAAFPGEVQTERESFGLWAISRGFTDVANHDDEITQKASFIYDALYSQLKREEGARD